MVTGSGDGAVPATALDPANSTTGHTPVGPLDEMRTIAAAGHNPENNPRWHELKHEVEEINRVTQAEQRTRESRAPAPEMVSIKTGPVH
jgi:hypothetical protein